MDSCGLSFEKGPRSPRTRKAWENGYCESFNGKLRDECLNGEIFYSLREAQIVIEQWRIEYNTHRPHSTLGYRPPAPVIWRAGPNPGLRQCLMPYETLTPTGTKNRPRHAPRKLRDAFLRSRYTTHREELMRVEAPSHACSFGRPRNSRISAFEHIGL